MSAKTQRQYVLFHNGGLGDFLMFVFLAEQLHAGGNAAHITIVVPRTGDFLRGFTLAYPYLTVTEASFRKPASFIGLLDRALRTTTVVIHPTLGRIPLSIKLFAWLLTRMPGSRLIGFKDEGASTALLYTQSLSYDTGKNYADTVRELARVAGGRADTKPPRLVFTPVNGCLEKYGLKKDEYIFFHPGAGMSARKRSFATEDALQIIRHLAEHRPELRIVLSGGPGEKEWIREMVAALEDARIVPLIAAPAQELATLIQNARLYIGGDTGVTHLACFVGARVLEVAHNASINWLCFYYPRATVLYLFADEEQVDTNETHIRRRLQGPLRPFGYVPSKAVCALLKDF